MCRLRNYPFSVRNSRGLLLRDLKTGDGGMGAHLPKGRVATIRGSSGFTHRRESPSKLART